MNPVVMAAFADELSSIHGIEKDAFLGSLAKGIGKMLRPKAAKPFKPSFKGHSKSLGLGTKKTPTGVVTQRSMEPGGLQQQKFVTGVEGWN
jgi:hypothetical protein